MEKYTTVITNKNEITKGEFDELNKVKNFDIFTPQQRNMALLNVSGLIKKGETQELNEDEQDLIKSITAELDNLTEYVINDMNSGRIVKTKVYVQPKQVVWTDTLEKSLTGETIKKGMFLDTPLNRKLNRVGDEIIKGKKAPKKEVEDDEEDDEMTNSDMYKAMSSMVKDGKGADKESLFKAISEQYPDEDKTNIKKCMSKMYKSISKTYMEKANAYDNMSKDDEEEEK